MRKRGDPYLDTTHTLWFDVSFPLTDDFGPCMQIAKEINIAVLELDNDFPCENLCVVVKVSDYAEKMRCFMYLSLYVCLLCLLLLLRISQVPRLHYCCAEIELLIGSTPLSYKPPYLTACTLTTTVKWKMVSWSVNIVVSSLYLGRPNRSRVSWERNSNLFESSS